MKHQGLLAFVLCLGLSLMEGWANGHLVLGAVWLAIGLFLLLMDRPAHARPSRHGHPVAR